MSTWLDAFIKQEPQWRDHPVHKVARHSIHFRADDGVHAFFVGKPAFERNAGGVWVPVQESVIPRLWQRLAALQSPAVRFRMRAFVIAGRLSPFATTTDFAAAAADVCMRGQNVTYATARSTATGTIANPMRVGQTTGYNVYRAEESFVTSSITTANLVTQVNLKITSANDQSATDFILQLSKFTPTLPIGSNADANFDAILSAAQDADFLNTADGFTVNSQYTSPNLDTTWVVRDGTTYYGFISKRDHDGSGTTPTGNEYVDFYDSDYAATPSYRPVLTVVYGAAPTGQFMAPGKYW